MIKEDIISYVKIIGVLLMFSPIIYWFSFRDSDSPILITVGIMLFLIMLAILMYNYLQYGLFWFWISKKYRTELKRKKYRSELKRKYGRWY